MAIQLCNIILNYVAYKPGVAGVSECPIGYCPIKSISRCYEASIEVFISGWNGENLSNDVNRLPYCWIGGDGKANYNSKGDSGPNCRTARLICETCRK